MTWYQSAMIFGPLGLVAGYYLGFFDGVKAARLVRRMLEERLDGDKQP